MSSLCGRGGVTGGWLWGKVLASSPCGGGGGGGGVKGLMAKVKRGKCHAKHLKTLKVSFLKCFTPCRMQWSEDRSGIWSD